MSGNQDNDDDSFILILGTSPGASMNNVEKCNGTINGDNLQKSQIEDAMKDLSEEANLAFKAQFRLGESPSPASMMVASTLITDDRSTGELQRRFGELIDENVVLKETLKQNNESMKEQFMLIASCQEDMIKTHKLHREKFDETRELVEKLRKENKQLKLDITRLADLERSLNNETGENKSGPSSGVEFVTSPDDDTIDKLTAQLDLVEKQRRQVIVENDKLTWQKESLEHIVDTTTKERDELKEKLAKLQLQVLTKENEHAQETAKLDVVIGDLQDKLQKTSVTPEQIRERDGKIEELQTKVAMLQNELKKAQIRILDLENIKLEYSQHKAGVAETVKVYREQVQELRNRIKEVQTTVFQPVGVSIGEGECSSEFSSYLSNVKLYDRTLKHLADYLNGLLNGLTDSLVETLGVVSSLCEMKIERASAERVRAGLSGVRAALGRQHSGVVGFVSNIRGTLSIFEGIFKDYNELMKKTLTKTDAPVNVEQLTSALLARGQEVALLQAQVAALTVSKDEVEVLRTQADLYKGDFEAERESREKMASEKDALQTDLRTAQRRVQELTGELEAHKKAGAKSSTAKRVLGAPATASATVAPRTAAASTVRKKKKVEEEVMRETTPPPLRYDCPVCDCPFRTLVLLQQHVDSCLG